MASLAYKYYWIVSVADFDALTLTWTPHVSVSWKIDGHHQQHALTSLPNLFFSVESAEDCGVKQAKAWIDGRA
jgi:hypothetical protein